MAWNYSITFCWQSKVIWYLIEECGLDPNVVDDHNQYPLHYAYRHGNVEHVKYLQASMRERYLHSDDVESVLQFENIRNEIEHTFAPENPCLTDADIDSCYRMAKQNLLPLQKACLSGNLRRVRSLVSVLTKEQLNFYKNMEVYNCLNLAVQSKYVPLICYMVRDLKWDPTHSEIDGNNAIYCAIHCGRLDIVKLFIEKLGCDPNRLDDHYYTPLHVASKHGKLQIVKYLINQCGPSPDMNSSDMNRTSILHDAAHFGRYQVVRYLLDVVKMNPNVVNNDGLTPLSVAAKEGHLNIVAYLLKLKDTVLYDRQSRTPLFHAMEQGHLGIDKFLMSSYNACLYSFVAKLTRSFSCPLPYATAHGHYDALVYLIKETKADPFVVYDEQSTLLELSLLFEHPKLVEYFLQKLRFQKPSFLVKFLHKSAKIGNLLSMNLLFSEFRLDPNIPNEEGYTLIYQAAYHGHLQLMRWLVEELKCDVNKFDCLHKRTTPLHTSASQGHLNIVMYLTLRERANPFLSDGDGNTAFHCATKSGHEEIAKFLSDYASFVIAAIVRYCWIYWETFESNYNF